MRVVTMAFLECFFFIGAFLAFLTAGLSHFWLPLAYLCSASLVFCFVNLIWMIPLNLNWSRSHYRHLLGRFFYFLIFTVACYAIIYRDRGIILDGVISRSWRDSIYFSVTTFTTLGYGDFRPIENLRLLTSLEAITGLAFVPAAASMIWLYCQDRLWQAPLDQEGLPEGASFRLDAITGVWKEGDEEKVRAEEAERAIRFRLNPCSECASDSPVFEKYYELLGRTSPLPKFRVYCKCGNTTSGMISAHAAAFVWNKRNKNRRTKGST